MGGAFAGDLEQSFAVFSPVGWIVGAIGASVFWISSLLFPPVLAVLLSMIATILLTGRFTKMDLPMSAMDSGVGGHRKRFSRL
jgi:adenosylcobinamide-GDP ribazoletransferase